MRHKGIPAIFGQDAKSTAFVNHWCSLCPIAFFATSPSINQDDRTIQLLDAFQVHVPAYVGYVLMRSSGVFIVTDDTNLLIFYPGDRL